jgi:hypothetical protein
MVAHTPKQFFLMKPLFRILLLLLFVSCLAGCGPRPEPAYTAPETLVLYTGRDTLLPGETETRMVAVPDHELSVDPALAMEEKISLIAAALSDIYFRGLEIQVISLEEVEGTGLVLHINLLEPEAFDGPGSLPSYQSWYDFFQGSYGGQQTSIRLKESFLQPQYQGPWIDRVRFFYNGQPLEGWDHLVL